MNCYLNGYFLWNLCICYCLSYCLYSDLFNFLTCYYSLFENSCSCLNFTFYRDFTQSFLHLVIEHFNLIDLLFAVELEVLYLICSFNSFNFYYLLKQANFYCLLPLPIVFSFLNLIIISIAHPNSHLILRLIII